MAIITFLTDFGTKSGYVSQMKGVALSLAQAQLVDITHEINPQDIREGAFVLQTSAVHFPVGSVHVAVVDPGVGTDRKGIFITAETQILVGPDNGILIPAAKKLGNFVVYEIKSEIFSHHLPSNTFHGRDIFTRVAAHILNGESFEKLGRKTNEFVDLDFGKCEITDKTATGRIIYIDNFGNIITNIVGTDLSKVLDYDGKIMAFIGKEKYEMKFVKSYGFVKKGQILATIGSSDFLEISINGSNAAKKLTAKPDDELKILFN